jgi:hypothetical protein
MKLPTFKNINNTHSNPVYKNLYEVHFISENQEINKTIFEAVNFKIDDNICSVIINDHKYIKLELLDKIRYLVVSIFDQTGSVIKNMKIEVNFKKYLYELSWGKDEFSQVTIIFNIVNLETTIDINAQTIVKELIRDLKLNNILDSSEKN